MTKQEARIIAQDMIVDYLTDPTCDWTMHEKWPLKEAAEVCMALSSLIDEMGQTLECAKKAGGWRQPQIMPIHPADW